MVRYGLLLAPSANRVYADAALGLMRAELIIFGRVLERPVEDPEPMDLAGVGYLGFGTPDQLTEQDRRYLARLSSGYALFEIVGDLLRPVELPGSGRFDDDLITIPKYAGKTNEQFTRLLLNVTILASASAGTMLDRRLTVLDPLCGRGTTLNQALMYGYDAVGIELDGKEVDSYGAFLRTYLRRKRLSHKAEMNPVRRDRKLVARRFEAVIGERRGPDREAAQRVVVFHADTAHAREFLRAKCADVVVADAPYGVAHGSHSAGTGLSRRPLALLREAAPVWAELLRPGGALGLAWNTHVADRDAAAEILADAGLTIVDGPGYRDLAHRVDQAIRRDVLVATKPAELP